MKKYKINEINILKLIYQNKQISRAEIARILKLERSTVSYIIKKLEEDKIIKFGEKLTTGGRTSINLQVNSDFCTNLVINLKKDSIIFDITSFDGKKISQIKLTNITTDQIISQLQQTINITSQAYKNLKNVVIAYHGMVNNNKRESFSPFYNISIFDIYKALEEKFNLNFFIKNESNLIALGLQDIHKIKNLLVVSIDQGIGCGIIVDSNLMTGSDGYAGEFGHQIVDINGPLCGCGNNGCIEMICSEKALKTADQSQIDLAIQYLSIGINNYLLTFNPQKIIIRSKLFYKQDHFIDIILANLKSKNLNKCDILSTYRHDSDVIAGATKYIFDCTINN